MALIVCPECKQQISDKATACPYCGYPLTDCLPQEKNTREIEKYNMLGDEMRTEQKYLAALECYTRAANLGSTHAQVWLGNMYSSGLGVGVNCVEAKKWYAKAAEQGDTTALQKLAQLEDSDTKKQPSVISNASKNTHTITNYDVPMPPKPKIAKGIIIYAALLFVLVLWLGANGGWGLFAQADFVGGFVVFLLGPIIIYGVWLGFRFYDYNLAQTDYPRYAERAKAIQAKQQAQQVAHQAELDAEYRAAVASQNRTEPWAVRYSTSPCPYCGHYKVRYAKWEDKQMSVAFWGAASTAIGKKYKCEHCNQMWE